MNDFSLEQFYSSIDNVETKKQPFLQYTNIFPLQSVRKSAVNVGGITRKADRMKITYIQHPQHGSIKHLHNLMRIVRQSGDISI